jgi:hypothetical protein
MFTQRIVVLAMLLGLTAGSLLGVGIAFGRGQSAADSDRESRQRPRCCSMMKPCCPNGPCCTKD